jgi:hypothetical protein
VREGSERRESEQKRERLWLECERMRLERSQIAKKTKVLCVCLQSGNQSEKQSEKHQTDAKLKPLELCSTSLND